MAEGFTNSLNNYGKLSLTNNRIRQGEFINTSRSFHQNIKDFLKKLFTFLKKLFQVFKQIISVVLSAFYRKTDSWKKRLPEWQTLVCILSRIPSVEQPSPQRT